MNTNVSSQVYGRVDIDKNIVEYPVYKQQILQRGHSLDWYKECVISDIPQVPKFHLLKENLEVRNDKVYVTYEVVEQSLASILISIRNTPVQGKPLGDRFISDVSQEMANRIMHLTDKYIEDKLDKVAQDAGYKNSDRLAGYVGSTNTKFASEAAAFVALRDKIWEDMPVYLESVMLGHVRLPANTAEIDSKLPNFTLE